MIPQTESGPTCTGRNIAAASLMSLVSSKVALLNTRHSWVKNTAKWFSRLTTLSACAGCVGCFSRMDYSLKSKYLSIIHSKVNYAMIL